MIAAVILQIFAFERLGMRNNRMLRQPRYLLSGLLVREIRIELMTRVVDLNCPVLPRGKKRWPTIWAPEDIVQ